MSKHELDFTGLSRELIEFRLSNRATEMAYEHWGVNLLNGIHVEVNGRLKSTLGCMTYRSNIIKWIEISKRLIDFGAPEVIENVLLHEVTHWVLLHKDKPFNDGHPYFEAELERVGSESSGKYRVGLYHEYKCGCTVHTTYVKIGERYRCNGCKERLNYDRTIAYDGLGNMKLLEEV